MLMLKRLRSVPLMGGPQGPSVSRSPGAAPQKKAGGPWAPPPRGVQIPGDVNGSSVFSFVVVSVLSSADCFAFLSLG